MKYPLFREQIKKYLSEIDRALRIDMFLEKDMGLGISMEMVLGIWLGLDINLEKGLVLVRAQG